MKYILIVLSIFGALISPCWGGAYQEALDGMEELMTGAPTFQNQKLLDDLNDCFLKFDPELITCQDAQWQGFLDYGRRGGSVDKDDPWCKCPEPTLRWIESNCTYQYGDVPIWEPCNYASNIAYYHTAVEICKKDSWDIPDDYVMALFENFAQLAPGSAFFHASQTHIGGVADVRLNDLFSYTVYQAMVEQLEPLDDPIIHELHTTHRNMTSIETTRWVRDVYLTQDVNDWDLIDSIDVPGVFLGMCGNIAGTGALLFKEDIIDIANTILDHINGFPAEDRAFCVDIFLPALLNSTKHIELDEEQHRYYMGIMLSYITKLVYGGIWQEEIFSNGSFLVSPGVNEWGARILPVLNLAANKYLNDFTFYNKQLNRAQNIYPGEEWCNPTISHAKWHLETGIGLVDLVFTANEFHKVFTPASATPDPDGTTPSSGTGTTTQPPPVNTGGLQRGLDGMQELMTGERPFQDQKMLRDLRSCFAEFDPVIEIEQDIQWEGFYEFSSTGGNPSNNDSWLPCTEDNAKSYLESNCTYQDETVAIWEPCNYASNVAYYFTAIEVCKKEEWVLPDDYVSAMFENFNQLPQGSAFMHGSHTDVGHAADIKLNDLMAYVAYQAMVAKLEPLDSTVIHELSMTPRNMSAVEMTQYVRETYLDHSVNEWADRMWALDVPQVEIGMCGILGTAMSVTVDDDRIAEIAEFLIDHIAGFSEEMVDFCILEYLPTIIAATDHIQLSPEEVVQYQGYLFSSTIKLLYGAIWQEEILSIRNNTFHLSPFWNTVGTLLLPVVNEVGNQLQDFTYYDDRFAHGLDLYPGSLACNRYSPHAKWHVETAVGLTDMLFTSNELYKILEPAGTTTTSIQPSSTSGQSATWAWSAAVCALLAVFPRILA